MKTDVLETIVAWNMRNLPAAVQQHLLACPTHIDDCLLCYWACRKAFDWAMARMIKAAFEGRTH